MSLATVDPISGAIPWSAKAAAGDALQRVPDAEKTPFMAIWIGEDGCIRYSKANTDGKTLSLFAVILMEMAQSCYRDFLAR